MRQPVLRPDRPVPRPRPLTLEAACALGKIEFTPERWGPSEYGEVFLRLLVKGIDHEYFGTSPWIDAITGHAPREGCVCGAGRVVESSPAPRRRRRRGSA
ncbi:MAG: hypothetical protein ACRD1S_07780 [Vicinamibacterales bacterium]